MAGVIHSKLGSSIPVGLSWYIVTNHSLGRGCTAFCGKGYRWLDWYCLLCFDFKTIGSYRLTIVIILSCNGIITYSKTCNLMAGVIHSKLCGSIPIGLSWYIVTNHNLGRCSTAFRSKVNCRFGWYCLLSFDFKTIRSYRLTIVIILSRNGISTYSKTCNLMAGVIHSKLGSSIPVGLSWYIVTNHSLGRGCTAFCGKGYRWLGWYCLLSFDFKAIRNIRGTTIFFCFYLISTCGKT